MRIATYAYIRGIMTGTKQVGISGCMCMRMAIYGQMQYSMSGNHDWYQTGHRWGLHWVGPLINRCSYSLGRADKERLKVRRRTNSLCFHK